MIKTNTEDIQEPLLIQRDPDYTLIQAPFSGDLLNRKPLSEHLTRYIDRLQVGAVLILDARWGEGKTWFVQHWKAHLQQTQIPHNVIYLNAFSQSHLEDPFMVLSAEISHVFDEIHHEHELIQAFNQNTIITAQTLLPELPQLLMCLGVTLMSACYMDKKLENVSGKDDSDFNKNNIFSGMNNTINDNIQEAIKERFQKYDINKEILQSFKQALNELVHDPILNPKPLVFIIDELERCNPTFSVHLIERIKYIFNIPNIVFVLVTDKTQLQATICHQFGYSNQAGEAYLDKFIDFTIQLEKANSIDRKDEYLKIISTTMADIGFPQKSIDNYQYVTLILATVYNKSIRQIKSILNRFSLLQLDNTHLDFTLLYKLFHPNVDNKIPLFVYMLYDFVRYFDKNLVAMNGNDIDIYVKKTLFSFRKTRQEYVSSDKMSQIESDIKNYFSQETSSFFINLSYLNRNYLHITREQLDIEMLNHFWRQLSIKPIKHPLDLNESWDEYIKTGLNE